jgi:hypothetical protein
MLKYSVVADEEGGELVVSRDMLLHDAVRGPLRAYIERSTTVRTDEDACRYLLCSPVMRVLHTPRTLSRVAVDATSDGTTPQLQISAEPGAKAIIALEFRHTLSA